MLFLLRRRQLYYSLRSFQCQYRKLRRIAEDGNGNPASTTAAIAVPVAGEPSPAGTTDDEDYDTALAALRQRPFELRAPSTGL